jgi:hypothetical protein
MIHEDFYYGCTRFARKTKTRKNKITQQHNHAIPKSRMAAKSRTIEISQITQTQNLGITKSQS